MALRNPAVPNHQVPNQIRTDGQSIETSNELTTVTDPFLGQTNSNDLHARQESADSGLGKGENSFHLIHHKNSSFYHHFMWHVLILYDFLLTVKAAPHECVIKTGQPKT